MKNHVSYASDTHNCAPASKTRKRANERRCRCVVDGVVARSFGRVYADYASSVRALNGDRNLSRGRNNGLTVSR